MKGPKINIQLTKEQQQYLAIAVVILGLFSFLYYKYFWSQWVRQINENQTKLAQMETKLSMAKQKAARLKELEVNLAQLKEAILAAERRLPKTKDVANLFDNLNQTALRYRIDLKSFQPQNPQTREYFVELPYQVSFAGSYHDLARFLTALGTMERIVAPRNLSLSAAGSSKPGITVTGSFTLVAYQYKG